MVSGIIYLYLVTQVNVIGNEHVTLTRQTIIIWLRLYWRSEPLPKIDVYDKRYAPNARKPVSDEGECRHEEQEDGGAILWVSIYFPGHPDQAQESSGFQETDEGGCLLCRKKTL